MGCPGIGSCLSGCGGGTGARTFPSDSDAAAVTQVIDGLPSSSLSCEALVVDMLDSLLLEPGHRVLELGTGTGRNAALLGSPLSRWMPSWPGGRIVTPWGRLGHVALTVAEDGRSATGWMQGLAQFMPARGTGRARVSYQEVRAAAGGPVGAVRPVGRRLEPLRDDIHLRFAVRVALPDVQIKTAEDDDGLNAWLHDGGSWAALSPWCTRVGRGGWSTSWTVPGNGRSVTAAPHWTAAA